VTTDLNFTYRFEPARNADTQHTLVLLHGTGGNEHDLIDLGRAIDPNAALLSPRGKVLENGMPRFFRRLAEGVFDLEDLVARTHELADFLSAAAAKYGRDPRRMVAVGFSNGANIAASLLLLRPEALTAAILLRPMVPLTPDELPDLRGIPVLIAAGQRDPIVTPQQSERLGLLLQSAGANVTLRWDTGGHNLSAGDLKAATDWLPQQLIHQ
jgi:predicted esterase